MKFKAFIYLSVIAMLILMAVQYYFIKETFQTKEEQFDNKFSSLAKLGLYEFNSKYFDFEEDSLLSMLDEYCYFAINDPAFNSNDASHDSLFNDLVNEFIFQLNQAELKEIFLEKYFKSNNDTLTFSSYMHITDLQIIYFDQLIPVINDTLRFHHIPHKNVSHINSYITERNYFRISYDYYLSFSERKTLIRKEMMLTMLLSGITLLIVFLIFFLTLRNLWIHKRLSDLN